MNLSAPLPEAKVPQHSRVFLQQTNELFAPLLVVIPVNSLRGDVKPIDGRLLHDFQTVFHAPGARGLGGGCEGETCEGVSGRLG